MKPFIFFTLLFFLFLNYSHAVPADSTKKEVIIPTLIKYIDGNAFSEQHIRYHSLDTSLDNLELINLAYLNHYNNLANNGSAVSPQFFHESTNILTDVGFHSYDLYLFNPEKIRYFKTNKAFSQINYHLAGGKEQQITVALSENILKNWNVGLDFNRLGSNGFLKNGTTFHNNVDLYTWFHSGNERYNLLASACWNSMINKVNGGLYSDSIYDKNNVDNLALQGLLINLTDAENHFRNHQFSLRQFYDVGFNSKEKTSDTTTMIRFRPAARIEHTISFESRSFTYLDGDPGTYYKNSYFTVSSLDSLHYYDLRNRISLTTLDGRKNSSDSVRAFYYSVGLEQQWLKYSQASNENLQFPDTVLQNVSVNGSIASREDETIFHWKVTGTYDFTGASKSDYIGDVLIHAPFKTFGAIDVSAMTMLKSPDLIYQRYFANHFIWENTFEKSGVNSVTAIYSLPQYKFSIGAGITSISNLVYLDSTALPVQSPVNVQVINYFLNKNFRFGKFHFNNSLIVQRVNHVEVLHLPAFISTHSFYYESFFYNNALLLQAGFEMNYHSLYFADAFMPATGLFYRQYENKTVGFALMDFFVNFRIKTARMFLKFENIGDNIFGKGYYLTPHYPMQGMTLQFGISWRFFDQ